MPVDPSDLATPTLIRAARGAYARSIRTNLRAIGVDDLPKNGAVVLFGVHSGGGPRENLPAGTRREQAGREPGGRRPGAAGLPAPRSRRVRPAAEHAGADRAGTQVVEAVWRGTEAIDAQLATRLSPEQIDTMRSGLMALSDIKAETTASGAGRPRPVRSFRQFSPIFPVREMAPALAHYASLGFKTFAYEAGEELRLRQPRRDRPPPGRRPRTRRRLHVPLRAGRRRPVRGVEPAGRRRRHPPRAPDAVRAPRGLPRRPGREPHPVRVTGGSRRRRRTNGGAWSRVRDDPRRRSYRAPTTGALRSSPARREARSLVSLETSGSRRTASS